jgi:hypothetical protein
MADLAVQMMQHFSAAHKLEEQQQQAPQDRAQHLAASLTSTSAWS